MEFLKKYRIVVKSLLDILIIFNVGICTVRYNNNIQLKKITT